MAGVILAILAIAISIIILVDVDKKKMRERRKKPVLVSIKYRFSERGQPLFYVDLLKMDKVGYNKELDNLVQQSLFMHAHSHAYLDSVVILESAGKRKKTFSYSVEATYKVKNYLYRSLYTHQSTICLNIKTDLAFDDSARFRHLVEYHLFKKFEEGEDLLELVSYRKL